MTGDLPVLWTPAQQAWLQAMGYTVLHDAALAAELDAAVASQLPTTVAESSVQLSVAPVAARPVPARKAPAAPATAPDPVAARAADPAAAARARTAAPLAADPDKAPAPAPRSGTPRQPSVRLPDRLQMALLRASGCNPSDPSTQSLMDSWPLETLRGNAAAKRALWPALRALRRKRAP